MPLDPLKFCGGIGDTSGVRAKTSGQAVCEGGTQSHGPPIAVRRKPGCRLGRGAGEPYKQVSLGGNMLSTLRSRASREEGFTLIELLVVILIVGILAAIALPTFLGQQKKGQDAAAKSDARNLVSHVESCFADTQDYTQCNGAQLGTTGLDIGTAAGQVQVVG